jgi:hypothetical protein
MEQELHPERLVTEENWWNSDGAERPATDEMNADLLEAVAGRQLMEVEILRRRATEARRGALWLMAEARRKRVASQ